MAGGTEAVRILSTGLRMEMNGSATTPCINNENFSNTGLFWGTTFLGITSSGAENVRFQGGANPISIWSPITFANLGTPANGSFAYCSDCDPGTLFNSTCTSSGTKTGAFARRVNGVWECD